MGLTSLGLGSRRERRSYGSPGALAASEEPDLKPDTITDDVWLRGEVSVGLEVAAKGRCQGRRPALNIGFKLYRL